MDEVPEVAAAVPSAGPEKFLEAAPPMPSEVGGCSGTLLSSSFSTSDFSRTASRLALASGPVPASCWLSCTTSGTPLGSRGTLAASAAVVLPAPAD